MTKRVSEVEACQIMETAGMQPLDPYPGRGKKWRCKCLHCGEVGYTNYNTVRRGGRGCKPCAIKTTAAKKRLSAIEVESILASAELRAVGQYTSTAKPLLCECLKCGNYVAPTLADVKRGARCQYCRRTKVDPKFAEQLAQKAGVRPLEEFRSASLTWKCLHIICGEIVYPHWTTLKSGGSGCMRCRAKNTSTVRRIKDSEAIDVMNKANFEPLEPYPDALSKWKSLCKNCLKVSYPRLSNIKNGTGCVYCSNKGLQISDPAFLYLMFNPEFQAHKVGVGGRNTKFDRITQHTKKGWMLFKVLEVKSGEVALEIEREILDFLFSECGLKPFLSSSQMPQGGHTETFDAAEIDLMTIWKEIIKIGEQKNAK